MHLTLKCTELLIAFARSPGKTLTKEQLIETAWRDTPASDATLAQHVFLLRRALRHGEARWIATVPQVGYRFVADVAGEPPAEEAPDEYVAGAEVFRRCKLSKGCVPPSIFNPGAGPAKTEIRAFRAPCELLASAGGIYVRRPLPLPDFGQRRRSSRAFVRSERRRSANESAYVSALFDRDFSAAARHLDGRHAAIRPDLWSSTCAWRFRSCAETWLLP